jgi:hypothetical protein
VEQEAANIVKNRRSIEQPFSVVEEKGKKAK